MTPERKGQIALVFLEYQIGQEGIKLGPNFRRRLGHIAKTMSISMKELEEFSEDFIGDLVAKHVKSKVS